MATSSVRPDPGGGEGSMPPRIPPSGERPLLLSLDDPAARDPDLTGGKAAALARARAGGLATLPGVVLTTAFSVAIDAGGRVAEQSGTKEAFTAIDGASQSLVVRSSSTIEDQSESSMAGRFESVVGVEGYDAFVDAVGVVLASRAGAAVGDPGVDAHGPIAILVQPYLDAASGGVLMGIDPVTGRTDRLVISAVTGGPSRLVSGEADGSRYELDTAARVKTRDHRPDGADLSRSQLRALADLHRRAAALFGGPQDIEWAFDRQSRLHLLQSRPVTTFVAGEPQGPVFGPGPVAETFPEPLSLLEEDLWVPPLRAALREAALLTGTAAPAAVRASPLLVTVGGYVAVDLQVSGEAPMPEPWWARFWSPAKFRRLRSAWRVGRLRAALPALARDLVERTDAELRRVPPLPELSDRQLLALLDRSEGILVSLHAHEILMGLIIDPASPRMTGASVALRVLAQARRGGASDAAVVAEHPVVLALAPPRIAAVPALPPRVDVPTWLGTPDSSGDAGIRREALRLRARWVQELTARAVWELATRLAGRGAVDDPVRVRRFRLEELHAVVTGQSVPVTVSLDAAEPAAAHLPACFRLTERGLPVTVFRGREDAGGTGAGGGLGTGPVTHDIDDPPSGSVLVVRNLSPSLAPILPRLGGLVAETGSVLAHLAILAREVGVPTVVGLAGALEKLPPGTMLTVNGNNGDVTIAGEEEAS